MAEKQYGMLVRTERCVGCQTCVVGCHLLHECPTDVYLGYLETVGQSENYLVTGTYPNVSVTFRPHLCNHCASPACVANCPTWRAIRPCASAAEPARSRAPMRPRWWPTPWALP